MFGDVSANPYLSLNPSNGTISMKAEAKIPCGTGYFKFREC